MPATKDILNQNYRGYRALKDSETHYPKMYTVQAVDLINGTISKFSFSNKVSEIFQARNLVKTLEANSITIYDRLHQNYEMALEHEKHGNYFLVRVKSENPKLSHDIQKFCRSNRRSAWVKIDPSYKLKKLGLPGVQLRLTKVKNKKSNRIMVFMTNLPEKLIKNKEIGDLYQRRWGIESSFKDLTDTFKMCQWHSSKLDGILQEIYALFWLVNNVRRITNPIVNKPSRLLHPSYVKANFKLTLTIFIDHIDLLIRGRLRKLTRILKYWVNRSKEKRKHLARSYPRQLKRHGKIYPNASTVTIRAVP